MITPSGLEADHLVHETVGPPLTGTQAAAGMFEPFLVPMIMDADPSRRAPIRGRAAQLPGGAFGPLLATDFLGVAWLRFTAGRDRSPEVA